MGDTHTAAFSEEELRAQATGNASALPYVIAAYAKDRGRPHEEATAFVGRLFAPGWESMRGQGARAVARMVALNHASCGGEVRSLSGDDDRAEVRVAGQPNAEDAAFFGVSRDEADGFFGVFGPIAESLGFRGEWRREGEEVVLLLDRTGG